jgi:tetrahydromethanopterin S-methyltransferase subunit E
MQEIHLTTREAILYLALIGTVAGLIMGLIPFVYGWRKGKTKLGIIGLIISTVAGAIWIVLPLLVVVIFVFLIARNAPLNSTSKEPEDPSPDDDDGSI